MQQQYESLLKQNPIGFIDEFLSNNNNNHELLSTAISNLIPDNSSIPFYSSTNTAHNQLFRFIGMVQDNGYEIEYYNSSRLFYSSSLTRTTDQPEFFEVSSAAVVSVPGLQLTRNSDIETICNEMQNVSIQPMQHKKSPLPWEKGHILFVQYPSRAETLLLGNVIEFIGYIKEMRNGVPCVCLIKCNKHVQSGLVEFDEVQALHARELTIEYLSNECSLGDKLLAEYLLLWLVSKIYKRLPDMALGPFVLCISNCTNENGISFGKEMSQSLAKLTSQVVHLPLTIDLMNKESFPPTFHPSLADHMPLPGYISAGILQLAEGTNVLVDLTCMTEGNLDQNGLNNLHCLRTCILEHRLVAQEDFVCKTGFSFPVDINWLLLTDVSPVNQSEKSLLPYDLVIPLRKCNLDGHGKSISQQDLSLIRRFLRDLKSFDHSSWNISDDMTKMIQNEFVEDRKVKDGHVDEFRMSQPKDLITRLCLARWVSVSKGEKELSLESWNHVKILERLRGGRLSNEVKGQ